MLRVVMNDKMRLKYTHMPIFHVIFGEVVAVSPNIHLLVFTQLIDSRALWLLMPAQISLQYSQL